MQAPYFKPFLFLYGPILEPDSLFDIGYELHIWFQTPAGYEIKAVPDFAPQVDPQKDEDVFSLIITENGLSQDIAGFRQYYYKININDPMSKSAVFEIFFEFDELAPMATAGKSKINYADADSADLPNFPPNLSI